MTASSIDRQRRSFDQLVEKGVYSKKFEHAEAAKAFVSEVLTGVTQQLEPGRPLTVLDSGCGTGAWLSYIAAILREAGFGEVRYCGFDLSGKMIELARRKLVGIADPEDLRVGNMLEESSYDIRGATAGVDLLFSYDAVQQLPRRQQYRTCEIIVNRLAPGGIALIFDNDSESRFGRRMAWRKFLTRYCGLSLVPRYYCNAAYPPLERFRQRLANASWETAIHVRTDQVKRALVIERSVSDQDAPP